MNDYENILQEAHEIRKKKDNKFQQIIENAIENYDKAHTEEKKKSRYSISEDAFNVMNTSINRENVNNRYISFIQTLRSSLLTEALIHIYNRSVPSELLNEDGSNVIIRSIISEYVNNIGYVDILNNMKKASVSMNEMYNIIESAAKEVIDDVDKENPETFSITPEMKDEFFKQLNYSDSEAIEDAIHDRVSTAMKDFVTANTKDHEDVKAALDDAQEEIGDIETDTDTSEEEKESIKESYQSRAKLKINNIRSAPKSVFHSMVTAVCESTIKHPEENSEFVIEGRLDMDKIIKRTGLMYTFMEMLNTSGIHKVDKEFVTDILTNLKA